MNASDKKSFQKFLDRLIIFFAVLLAVCFLINFRQGYATQKLALVLRFYLSCFILSSAVSFFCAHTELRVARWTVHLAVANLCGFLINAGGFSIMPSILVYPCMFVIDFLLGERFERRAMFW